MTWGPLGPSPGHSFLPKTRSTDNSRSAEAELNRLFYGSGLTHFMPVSTLGRFVGLSIKSGLAKIRYLSRPGFFQSLPNVATGALKLFGRDLFSAATSASQPVASNIKFQPFFRATASSIVIDRSDQRPYGPDALK